MHVGCARTRLLPAHTPRTSASFNSGHNAKHLDSTPCTSPTVDVTLVSPGTIVPPRMTVPSPRGRMYANDPGLVLQSRWSAQV